MEIKISISAKVSIQDGRVNVNEILYEADKFGNLLKKLIAERIIEHYQSAVISRMCDTEEGLVVKHVKKGGKSQICEEKRYTREGARSKKRGIKADFGELRVRIENVKCRKCGRIFTPITRALKIDNWGRKTEGLVMKVAETISKQSYGYSVGSLKDISGVTIPKATAHRWIVGEDWKDLELGRRGKEIASVLVDGTGYKRQIIGGGKGDIRFVIGITDEGERRVLGVWANKDWGDIGKEVKEDLNEQKEKPGMLTPDGEQGIAESLGDIARFHQRCIWHEKRDLGYAMWKDGVEKKERDSEVERLSGIIGMQLPGGEHEFVREEDKEGIRKRLDSCKDEFNKLIKKFEEKGYNKGATYLKNSVSNIFSHIELWLEVGIISPRTTSLLESIIRQVGRRTKKIGATWSDGGIEKVVKIFLKKTYESSDWGEYWKKRMGISDGCKINLLSITSEARAT